MQPYYAQDGLQIYHGDVLRTWRVLPAGLLHCVVTSPPYWALRDYSVAPTVWGGDETCCHQFEETPKPGGGGTSKSFRRDQEGGRKRGGVMPGSCVHCGAWKGCLGNEPTPELFVRNMVLVFREVHRVLRDDGTLFLNMGDSYSTSGTRQGNKGRSLGSNREDEHRKFSFRKPEGIKTKELIGVPWRLALALSDDGWYLRNEIIWAKRSPMPESVDDRATRAHEHIFLFSKKPKYYFDSFGASEPVTGGAHSRGHGVNPKAAVAGENRGVAKANSSFSAAVCDLVERRNMRTVWPLSTYSYKGAHFATYPPELVRRCLTAGMSEAGCCAKCGAPYKRLIHKARLPTRPGIKSKVHGKNWKADNYDTVCQRSEKSPNRDPERHVSVKEHIGWTTTCKCGPIGNPIPCILGDPFHGAGTDMVVAKKLGYRYVGCELSEDYIKLSIERLNKPLFFPHEKKKSKPKKTKPLKDQRELFA